MNLNAELSKDSFVNFYDDNKDYIIPIGAIVVSIVLFFVVILPQLTSIPQKKGAFDQEVEKVNKLKDYQKMVQGADVALLDEQMRSVSSVLPPAKDFESILNAILGAANNTSTIIESYQFQTDVLPGTEDNRRFPQLKFSIEIIGSASQAVSYINELYSTAPISEVDSISTKDDTTVISALFFYKPFPPLGFEERTSAKELSPDELKIYNEVSQWSLPLELISLPEEISSLSAPLSEE